MTTLCFDIGGTAIKSAVVTADGVIHDYGEHSYAKGRDGVLQTLHRVGEACAFDAIGISTTGLVDTADGSIIFCSDAIPGYTGTKLKSILESRFFRPVWVMNDVNAAALGEAHFGAGKAYNDFICLTFGTGIGGAIVINKHIYGGKSGFAGEIGHVVTHINGVDCVCGARGCYGQYASATALVQKCMEFDERLTNGRIIMSAFAEGNLAVMHAVDLWIDEIVLGLITVTHVFNPYAIIMGGGIMKCEYIPQQVQKRLSAAVMPGYEDVRVLPALLGNKAGLMGSAKYTWEKCGI